MERFDIVFWQKSASVHQAPLLKSLAELHAQENSGQVVLNLTEGVPERRLEMGWGQPDYGNVTVQFEGASASPIALEREQCHVFSGFGDTEANRQKFSEVVNSGQRPIVMLEAPDSSRIGPYLGRLIKYKLISHSLKNSHVTLLAMGQLGVQAYARLGFNKNLVHEFGYFVDVRKPSSDLVSLQPESPCLPGLKLLFVGSLVKLKGVHSLLHVLSMRKEQLWNLVLVGDGPCRSELEALSDALGLTSRVHFLGVKTQEETLAMIKQADFLLLPSKYDGWGAVVSEALSLGTPVIVSSNAGSSSLISDNGFVGRVFTPNSRESLLFAVDEALKEGAPSATRRQEIKTWAEGTISPSAAAEYLYSQIAFHRSGSIGPPPIPPWSSEFSSTLPRNA